MACLFTINKKGTAVVVPEAMKLSPDFAYLEEKEMLCVILAYDYYSFLRQFPEDERKRRARAHVFGHENEKIFEQPKIIKAVDAYKSLQYDPIRNQIVTLKRKLDNLNMIIDKVEDDDLKRIKEVMAVASEYRKGIKEWEEELNKQEEEGLQEDQDKTKLSFLEKLQSNSARYKELKKRQDGITGPKLK